MSFSSTQIRKLQQALHPDSIRSREVNGRQMSYIEGWHAIAEANRIFGFDAWSRETVESRCVLSRESKGTYHTVYIAKVRITVRTPETTILREGYGTGDAQAPSAGEAHDKAIKTAETDATKRALATFGKPFGLSLYLGSRLRDKPIPEPKAPIERRRTLQRVGSNGRYHVMARKLPIPDPALMPANATIAGAEREQRQSQGQRPGSEQGQEQEQESALPQPDRAAEATSGELGSAEHGSAEFGSAESGPAEVRSEALRMETPTRADPSRRSDAETFPSSEPDSGPMLIARSKRRRDANHLHFVAGQPCLVCSRTPSDAHHLKFAQPHALSRKVSDEFTVPLCRIHHRQLHHGGNELHWWIDMEIDPLPIAKDLWDKSKAAQKP